MTQRDMRRAFARAAIGVVVIIALAVGGVWLWGRPRSHVHPPTAQASPTDVVRAYEKALRDRDFSGARSLTTDEDLGLHWWSYEAPWFEITHLGPVTVRDATHPLKTYGRADSWKEAAEVRTTSTLHDFSGGASGTEPGMTWTFYLVREDATHPWKIVDQGSA